MERLEVVDPPHSQPYRRERQRPGGGFLRDYDYLHSGRELLHHRWRTGAARRALETMMIRLPAVVSVAAALGSLVGVLRIFPLLLLVGFTPLVSGAAAQKWRRESRPQCALPTGWRVVGQNTTVVVIADHALGEPGDLAAETVRWRYCFRSNGRFKRLTSTDCPTDCFGVQDAKLAGTYLGYWEADGYHASYETDRLYVWSLRNGTHASATNDQGIVCYPPFGVSSSGDSGYLRDASGVAVWHNGQCSSSGVRTEFIAALNENSGQLAMLDQVSEQGLFPNLLGSVLANLQLYDCAGGCSTPTSVVAWTHSGTWHYAQVS
jgi:hypothetical protein